jgi:hypothetical protein
VDAADNTAGRQGELLSVHMENPCPSGGNYLSAHMDYELSAVSPSTGGSGEHHALIGAHGPRGGNGRITFKAEWMRPRIVRLEARPRPRCMRSSPSRSFRPACAADHERLHGTDMVSALGGRGPQGHRFDAPPPARDLGAPGTPRARGHEAIARPADKTIDDCRRL